MRILYGVVGEGMGHAMRSRVVIDHLTASGHEVQVVVSGRAHDYLKARESDRLGVNKIWGLTIVYEDNEVRNFRTVLQNVAGAVTGGWPQNVRAYFDLAEQFRPDAVVSDFESWSHLFARTNGLPVISLDNMQVLARCTHAAGDACRATSSTSSWPRRWSRPSCPAASTTWSRPSSTRRSASRAPACTPRSSARRSWRPGPSAASHLLVYQTSESNAELPALLAGSGRECRIYGFRRDLKEEVVEGNLRFRPFSERTFVDDLRTAAGRGLQRRLHHPLGGGLPPQAGARLPGAPASSSRCSTPATSRRRATAWRRTRPSPPPGWASSWNGCRTSRRRLAGYRQDGNADMLGALDRLLAEASDGGHQALDDLE